METYKEYFNKSIPFVILISVISLDIILLIGLVNVFFYSEETIIAGVIAFCGAIIGGAITLIGVLVSIQHNAKLRMKNDLPNKIRHIESALQILEKIIEIDLVFDSETKSNRFITISKTLKLEKYNDFNEFTESIPEELKSHFIYVDADAYRMYLRYRNNVQLLGMKLLNDAEIELLDFKSETIGENNTDFMDKVNILVAKGDPEYNEGLSELNNALHKKDREFTFQLGMIYKDIHTQLILKNDKLIEDLDY